MSRISTFSHLQQLVKDNELRLDITQDNTYILDGIDSDIESGLVRVERNQLEQAVELLQDVAEYTESEDIEYALSASTPLGWLIAYILDPESHKLKPTPPFDNEATAWNALIQEFAASLTVR